MKRIISNLFIVTIIIFANVMTYSQDRVELKKEYEVIQVAPSNKPIKLDIKITPLIQKYVTYYQKQGRNKMEFGIARSGMFQPLVSKLFGEEKISEDLMWISQITNDWGENPKQGLWSFRNNSDRKYGLRKTAFIDEKLSYERATRAIARCLKFLEKKYSNDWKIALAAYYSGEKTVDSILKKSKKKSFESLYPKLPHAERDFVPKVLATILIANDLAKYGFDNVEKKRRMTYDKVRIPASIEVGLIAYVTNTPHYEIVRLNPELRTSKTPLEPYIIRVPSGKGYDVVKGLRNFPKLEKPPIFVPRTTNAVPNLTITGIKIVLAKKGDTVKSLAERHGVSVADVAKLNGLFVMSRLVVGRKIKILKVNKKTTSQSNKEKKTEISPIEKKDERGDVILIPKPKYKIVRAELNDTFETLACRYNVSVEEIIKLNQPIVYLSNYNFLGRNDLQTGPYAKSRLVFRQKVKIPLEQNYRCVNQLPAKFVLPSKNY